MSVLTGTWPLGAALAGVAVAGLLIAVFGTRLARVADELADRTGLGEAITGAVLLGAATSVAGLTATVVAAAEGDASLAISNSVGGIAAQSAFVVAADLAYRSANIEHAAASLTNLFTALVMIALLGVVLMGVGAPAWTVAGVHPATALIVGGYLYGLHLGRTVGAEPMWRPTETAETRHDEPELAAERGSLATMVLRFVGLAAVVAVAGWVVGRAGLSLVAATGLGGTAVGVFFTSTTTSLPELVTAIAAVRSGALTLAVAGLVGGNAFDVTFVAVADVVFRDGSIYAAAGPSDVFVIGWAVVLVAVIAAGLVRRERAGIGFEGAVVLAVYAAGLVTVSLIG